MAKQEPKLSGRSLNKLYDVYDEARRLAKEAEKDKVEASNEIKVLLGETVEASTDRYIVTYKYDKDREDEVFDEEKFETKDPKKYQQYVDMLEEIKGLTKKYTKIVVTKGSRKLIVTSKED
jgi:FMN phosphatase YigB (HAD superfamily)